MATKDKLVIFVSHSIDDDIAGTLQKIQDICMDIYHREMALPVAPYILALLTGNKGLGIELSLVALDRGFVDQVWLFGDRISGSMRVIINFARARNIPVCAKSEGTRRSLEILLAQKENDSPPA